MSISHGLALFYFLLFGHNFEQPTHTLTPWRFFSQSKHFFPGSEGVKAATKNEVD